MFYPTEKKQNLLQHFREQNVYEKNSIKQKFLSICNHDNQLIFLSNVNKLKINNKSVSLSFEGGFIQNIFAWNLSRRKEIYLMT